MTILAITRFDSKYSCIDSETLKLLQSKFEGAKAVVQRDSGPKTLSMGEIKLFDEITSIVNLPEGSKFSKVEAGMGAALEGQGFFEFSVVGDGLEPDPPPAPKTAPPVSPPQPSAKAAAVGASSDPAHESRMAAARDFVEKFEVAIENREESTLKIEEMMDSGRAGKFNTKGAAESVEKIIREGAAESMTAVAGLKASDQTYAHCVDMAVIFRAAYSDMLADMGKAPTEEICRTTLIAGFLHDIGKIMVPKEILDSKERFERDSPEMVQMRSHPVHSRKILTDLGMSKAIVNVASYHHVKTDTSLPSSYPDVSYDEVLPVTRLAAVVDVYQALIGSRSYKPKWVPGKAVGLLMELRGSEFDDKALGNFMLSNGIYPTGSLVRLSTGDLAFVVKNERKSLEQPVVVIVENADGELLTHHELLDLIVQPELSIAEFVDHYEYYSESPDQTLQIFRSINLG
ncbi:MAG: HD domain-containing protein [SAR324 cluster bacterium]|nr:HD domain-containing protein [SAR324 cluster bacterium]